MSLELIKTKRSRMNLFLLSQKYFIPWSGNKVPRYVCALKEQSLQYKVAGENSRLASFCFSHRKIIKRKVHAQSMEIFNTVKPLLRMIKHFCGTYLLLFLILSAIKKFRNS